MAGLTLDAGALIAFERNDRRTIALLARCLERRASIVVPSVVVAQVWRDGRRQVRLTRLLGAPAVEIEALDDARARAAGQLCGLTGTADIVDAAVVLSARLRGHPIATSDGRDLRRLDPAVVLIDV